MLASIAVVVAALYLAKGVLVPMTLAVLLSFLLSPVCDWLERHWLGRVPAVLITALVGFAVLGGATWMAVVQMSDLAPRMPEYETNLKAKFQSANAHIGATLGRITRTAQGMSENLSQIEPAQRPQGTNEWPYSVRIISSPASPLQVFGGMFGTVLEVLASIGVVIVLVVFFLIRRDDLRDRFIRLIGQGQMTLTTQMLEDAGRMVKILIAPSSHHSRRFSVVVPQKSAEPLATSDSPRTMPYSNGGKQQDVAFALMIALSVEVRNVFGECSPQGALTEQNQLGQTLLFH
jgi:predicted PurR-regulated permease PerM